MKEIIYKLDVLFYKYNIKDEKNILNYRNNFIQYVNSLENKNIEEEYNKKQFLYEFLELQKNAGFEKDLLNEYTMVIASSSKNLKQLFTPQKVNKLLSKLIIKNNKKCLFDCSDATAGTGSTIISSIFYNNGDNVLATELDEYNCYCCLFNFLIRNLNGFVIQMDTLELQIFNKWELIKNNKFSTFKKIDNNFKLIENSINNIVANPPYSANWSADDKYLLDERFSAYGKLAPKSKADYAFIQHMIFQLDDKGTMAVVLPHGVLFRGASEGVIRKYLINEKNYLDAIIGLPANIFFGTSIPTVILVFKKCREHNDNILFIDASKCYEKGKNQNIIKDEDVEKIIDTYKERKEIEKFSHIASLKEIEENEYNLNIPRYVDTFEEEEQIDLKEVQKQLDAVELEIAQVDKELEPYLKELGLL